MNPTSRTSAVTRVAIGLLTASLGLLPLGAAAEPREGWEAPRSPAIHHEPELHRGGPEMHRGWPGDARHFHEVIVPRWRTGRWIHGDHLGRAGWWWVVEGEWYFYPAPIYPYPDPYVPPGVVVAAPPAPPAPVQYWYYCASSQTYYPYVSACSEGWTPVVPPAGS
jgi:hypothetical protein